MVLTRHDGSIVNDICTQGVLSGAPLRLGGLRAVGERRVVSRTGRREDRHPDRDRRKVAPVAARVHGGGAPFLFDVTTGEVHAYIEAFSFYLAPSLSFLYKCVYIYIYMFCMLGLFVRERGGRRT